MTEDINVIHRKAWNFIRDFFSKCDQIHKKLRIWPHLLKKSLMENVSFCAVSKIELVAMPKFIQRCSLNNFP